MNGSRMGMPLAGRRVPWRRIVGCVASLAMTCVAVVGTTMFTAGVGASVAYAADGGCNAGTTNYVTDESWTGNALGLGKAHAVTQGAGVTVAVVDSGVSVNNPHLQDAVLPGTNLAGDDVSDGRTDNYGHGTVVAGIIAARAVSGSSLLGVAPQARILPVRVFDKVDQSQGLDDGGPSLDALAAGIVYAADQGAQIINVSMSNVTTSPALKQAVDEATAKGSLIVASAGNRNTSSSTQDGLRYPAAYDTVLGVAASDTAGHASDDSIHGAQVDVLAPGMEVLSAVPYGVDCVYASDSASSSFATAYASGVAALVAAAHPDETPAQWKQRIEATGNRPDPDSRDDERGWGMVDPYDAVNVHLVDGIRGPLSDDTSPYWDTTREHTEPVVADERANADRMTKRIVGVTGFAVVVLTMVMLGVSRARGMTAPREDR